MKASEIASSYGFNKSDFESFVKNSKTIHTSTQTTSSWGSHYDEVVVDDADANDAVNLYIQMKGFENRETIAEASKVVRNDVATIRFWVKFWSIVGIVTFSIGIITGIIVLIDIM